MAISFTVICHPPGWRDVSPHVPLREDEDQLLRTTANPRHLTSGLSSFDL